MLIVFMATLVPALPASAGAEYSPPYCCGDQGGDSQYWTHECDTGSITPLDAADCFMFTQSVTSTGRATTYARVTSPGGGSIPGLGSVSTSAGGFGTPYPGTYVVAEATHFIDGEVELEIDSAWVSRTCPIPDCQIDAALSVVRLAVYATAEACYDNCVEPSYTTIVSGELGKTNEASGTITIPFRLQRHDTNRLIPAGEIHISAHIETFVKLGTWLETIPPWRVWASMSGSVQAYFDGIIAAVRVF